ncbi:MAG: FkbM family methyltransferase [Pseudomonadales bacterium]|nr:FkbM family methyltransferase [Pseudomonadales bacterium]
MNEVPAASAASRRAHIAALLAQSRDYRQEVKELTRQYQYVVFYGCGTILSNIVATWNARIGRRIDYCCDSDSGKWGKVFCGARCISPDELTAIKDKCAVFVTIGEFGPVYDFLLGRGFPSVNLIYKYDLDAAAFLAHHSTNEITTNLCATHALLADAKSRFVFDAIVSRVLSREKSVRIMSDVCERHQYFPPDIITLSDHEALVDIGAFDGDTLLDFVRRTGGRFDRIFSFEVDAINYRRLEKTIQRMPEKDRIRIFNLGIWDIECDITYSIGGADSKVGAVGEGRGHVVPLDDVLKGEKVTLIKMDIEGAEPNALRGARRIIQTQKPKLAVCVYHDFRHLWELPLFIKSLVPEYKIYLRHHTRIELETVCYATL